MLLPLTNNIALKTMTCSQLGGACDLEFRAETFEEIASMSKNHGMEMFAQNDEAHLAAMKKMKEYRAKPGAFEEWMAARKAEFEASPEL